MLYFIIIKKKLSHGRRVNPAPVEVRIVYLVDICLDLVVFPGRCHC